MSKSLWCVFVHVYEFVCLYVFETCPQKTLSPRELQIYPLPPVYPLRCLSDPYMRNLIVD